MKSSKYDKKPAKNMILMKFNSLLALIESHNPNIDNFELRWVEAKIEELRGRHKLTREDLEKANEIYKKWNFQTA